MKRKYPEYKECGIKWLDEVPEHWSINQLRRVADVNNSNVNKKSYEDETPVRLCNYTDVYYNEYITDDMELMQSTASESEIDQYTLKEGDVIITKDSEDWDDIGVPACVAEPLTNVLCGYHLTILKGHEGELDGRFLLRALQSSGIKEQLHVAARGITRYGLSLRDMKRLLLPIPPLEEQRAIAAYLDRKTVQIDTLIAKKQRLIDLLEEQRTAVINRAVTQGLDPDAPMQDSGIEWLGEVPAHWKESKVKYELKSLNPRRVPLSSSVRGRMENKVYDYYGASGVIDKVDDYIFDETLILIGEDGANLLSRSRPLAFLAHGKYWVNNHAHILKPRYGNIHYLVNLLESIDYVPYVTGAAQPKLTSDNLGNIQIPVPPQDEQDRIADHIRQRMEELNKVIGKEERLIQKLQELRTSLISEVVTGKIDVRDDVPAQAEVAA